MPRSSGSESDRDSIPAWRSQDGPRSDSASPHLPAVLRDVLRYGAELSIEVHSVEDHEVAADADADAVPSLALRCEDTRLTEVSTMATAITEP